VPSEEERLRERAEKLRQKGERRGGRRKSERSASLEGEALGKEDGAVRESVKA
jgi:hypothetical protein